MARLRFDDVEATLGATLVIAGTTITFGAKLAGIAGDVPTISSPDYIALVLNDEIMHLTAYTTGATTGTVLRAQAGTTAVEHTTGTVTHTVTAADFDEYITTSTLTTNDDLLTRAAGVPDRITRAGLAADSAFADTYAPLAASDKLLAGKTLYHGTGLYTWSDATGVLKVVAADAAVSFVVPASGQVMVELSMYCQPSLNRWIYVDFHDGAGYVFGGPGIVSGVRSSVSVASQRATVSGLTPGASLTWTLHAKNEDTSGTGYIRIGAFGNTYGVSPLSIRVLETADTEQKSTIT